MREMGNEKINKLMSFFNKILEFINSFFKLIIIICVIIFLVIYYQSTLNNRYQYHLGLDDAVCIIFDTKKGEVYALVKANEDKKQLSYWARVSPFSKREFIPDK